MPELAHQIVIFGSPRVGNPPRFSDTWAIMQRRASKTSSVRSLETPKHGRSREC